MIALDVIDANSQAIETVLDDELFYIILNWNSSNSSWSLDIRNSSYEDLIFGIALVPNYPLTWQFRYRGMPKGELIAGSAKDRNGPIPRDGFSSGKYELAYIPIREVATAELLLPYAVRSRL
jgi:hypothetical protein